MLKGNSPAMHSVDLLRVLGNQVGYWGMVFIAPIAVLVLLFGEIFILFFRETESNVIPTKSG